MFLLITLCLPALFILGITISPQWPLSTGRACDRKLSRTKLWRFSWISFIISALISGGLYGISHHALMDREVWHFKNVKVVHQEEWTTDETRTRRVYSYTDSKGNAHYRTETYHVTEHHGPYWDAIDERGCEHTIDPGTYSRWAKIWNNQRQSGVHKGSSTGFDHAMTGRIFECNWTKDFERIYAYSEIHTYENRVRHSNSVFKGKEPTKELEAQYPRPAEVGNTSSVIGYNTSTSIIDAESIDQVNAQLGPKYLVHSILVVLNKNAVRSQVDDILTAWHNVNKNELVTFICLDGKKVKWCEVHSWMDNTTIHASIRDALMEGDFSTKKYVNILMLEIPKHWFKKDFRDFNYLEVEISSGWKITALILVILAMVALFFLIENTVELDHMYYY